VAPTGRHASRRTSKVVHCYTINSFTKKSGDDDADSLKYFNALHASCSFFIIFSISIMPLIYSVDTLEL
jgi:hypothetical protein